MEGRSGTLHSTGAPGAQCAAWHGFEMVAPVVKLHLLRGKRVVLQIFHLHPAFLHPPRPSPGHHAEYMA